MRAFAIHSEILNLEEDSKWTEWHIITHRWWVMACVLLLRQFYRYFCNRYIGERLRLGALSKGICQSVNGFTLSALCVIADRYFHPSKIPHEVVGTSEHSCI